MFRAKGGPMSYYDLKYNKELMQILGRGAKDLGYNVTDPQSPSKIGEISNLK